MQRHSFRDLMPLILGTLHVERDGSVINRQRNIGPLANERRHSEAGQCMSDTLVTWRVRQCDVVVTIAC